MSTVEFAIKEARRTARMIEPMPPDILLAVQQIRRTERIIGPMHQMLYGVERLIAQVDAWLLKEERIRVNPSFEIQVTEPAGTSLDPEPEPEPVERPRIGFHLIHEDRLREADQPSNQ